MTPPGRFVPGVVSLESLAAPHPGEAPRHKRNYPSSAQSPLWWFLASIVLGIAGYAIVIFAVVVSSDTASTFEDWTASFTAGVIFGFVLLIVAMICTIVGLLHIGANGGTFGGWVVANALFPVWAIIFLIGGELGILVSYLLYYCWPYRQLVTGIWAAGRLPRAWALLGWVPAAVGMLLIAIVAGVSRDQVSSTSDTLSVAGLVPVLGMMVSGVFAFGATVTVVIIQHIGISEDRRALRARPV